MFTRGPNSWLQQGIGKSIVRPAYIGRFQDTTVISRLDIALSRAQSLFFALEGVKTKHLQWDRCTCSEISGYNSGISLPWELAFTADLGQGLMYQSTVHSRLLGETCKIFYIHSGSALYLLGTWIRMKVSPAIK